MAHPTHSDLGSVQEQRLLRQVAAGDSSAFATIYTAYEGRLYGFCHRLTGSDADAADLVQETFLRVMARIPEMDTSTLNLSAYLYTTARNLFYKQVDKSKRIQLEDRMEDRAGSSSAIEEQPEAAALLSAQQLEVRNAHERLSPRQRMVLSLREVEDRSYADIGTVLGMNENAVAQLLSRARLRLREELRIEQVDVSKLPEECRKRLPAISAYLDGQLKGNRRDEFERHIEDCKHCRAVLAAFGDASHRYRAFLPLALPLAALWPATAHAAAGAGLISSAADAIAAHGAATSGGGAAAGSAGAGGVAASGAGAGAGGVGGVGGVAGAAVAGAAGSGGIGALAVAATVGVLVVGGAGVYGITQLVSGSSQHGAASVTDSIPQPSTTGAGSPSQPSDGAAVALPEQSTNLSTRGTTASRRSHTSNHVTLPAGPPAPTVPPASSSSSQSSSSATSTSSPPGSSTRSEPRTSTSTSSTSTSSSTRTTTATPATTTRTTGSTPATTTAPAPPVASAPPATTVAPPATTTPPTTATVPTGPPVFTVVSIKYSAGAINVIVGNGGGPAPAGNQTLYLRLEAVTIDVPIDIGIPIGPLGAGDSTAISSSVPCSSTGYPLTVVASFDPQFVTPAASQVVDVSC